MFAGSGALGLEALSRAAESVTLIENNPVAARQLQTNISAMAADNATVKQMTAQAYLKDNQHQFDIVFIDPPYQADVWTEVANLLNQSNCLADGAMIYLECPSKQDIPSLPANWQLLKQKKAGDVRYCLLTLQQGEQE